MPSLIDHFMALAASALVLGLITTTFYGWGAFLYRHLIDPCAGQPFLLPATTSFIWTGWSSTLVLFQALHLLVPLCLVTTFPIFLLGILFAIFHLRQHRGLPLHRVTFSPNRLILFLLFLTGLAWTLSRAMLTPTNYDSGLYHFNAIRWITTFPAFPGLGNLHGRLAFNSSFFTFAATLGFEPLYPYGRSLANAFLFLLTAATLSEAILRPTRETPAPHQFPLPCRIFASLVFPILLYLATASIALDGLSSPTPDFASVLLQITIAFQLLRFLFVFQQSSAESLKTGFLVVLLASTAITLKLSNLAFAGASIAIVIALLATEAATLRPGLLSIRFLTLPLVIGLIWILRGYLSSGVPLYPSTLLWIPFDWAIPVEKIIEESRTVRAWARFPGAPPESVLGSWGWLKPWLHYMGSRFHDTIYPLCFTATLSALATLCALRSPKKQNPRPALPFLVTIPPTLSIPFWFFTAPDPRFVFVIILLLPVIVTSLVLTFPHLRPRLTKRVRATALGLLIIASQFHLLHHLAIHGNALLRISIQGWQALPTVPMNTKTTKSGLQVHVPAHGDQSWDAPLPSTPRFSPNLRLREPGDPAAGFTVKPPDSPSPANSRKP